MRKQLTIAVLAALAGMGLNGLAAPAYAADAAPPPAAKPATDQAQIPVRQVVLFSSGVGYFEHFGSVRGNGDTELRFKTAQINDVLKSLVLQDLDKGRVGVVTYPSQDPVSRTLRSFQVDLSANPALHDLLNQLRGADVTVTLGAEKVSGTVLGVEKKQQPGGDKDKPQLVDVWVLNLISGATIRPVPLEGVRDVQLQDDKLRDELHKALVALVQARDQDKKPVTISFRGDGDRRVRIGYVVESPVWKTSYRLILDAPDAAGKDAAAQPKDGAAAAAAGKGGNLQGWAIVENQTDNDWTDVQLSLVSGRPISFIQNLYQPLYIPRPIVQPELFASLTPQTYDAGLGERRADMGQFGGAGGGGGFGGGGRGGAPGGAAPAASAAPMRQELSRSRAAGGLMAQDAAGVELKSEALGVMDATSSVASAASAAKLGELFQYTVGSVSLPRQKSAMIPIVTDAIEAERVSIYNQNVLAKHPLNGARLKNTTGKHLLAGPVTVLDAGSYAGDARVDNVPPGQERLLSYGIDLQVLVDAAKNRQDDSVLTGKVVKGVLTVSRKHVFTQEYITENKGDNAKTLVIEHPRRGGWSLVDTDKPVETTDAVYRFKGGVPAGKTNKLVVKEQIVDAEEIAILPADIGQLEVYARTGEIPKPVRDALVKAAQLKGQMVDTQRQIQERQQKVAEISGEQQRLRENMKTVSQNTEYYNRLLKKLDEQETQIEQFQGQVRDLQKTLNGQRQGLEDYLGNLNVG